MTSLPLLRALHAVSIAPQPCQAVGGPAVWRADVACALQQSAWRVVPQGVRLDDWPSHTAAAHADDGGAQERASLSSKSQVFDDATAEIADIDTRLHALQSFLRMAKSSSSGQGQA